jgi:hypothetical protein
VVAAFSKDMLGNAMEVAALLRKAGATVDMQQEPKKKVTPPPPHTHTHLDTPTPY